MQLWSNIKSVLIGVLFFSGLKSPEASLKPTLQKPTTSFDNTSFNDQVPYHNSLQINETSKNVAAKQVIEKNNSLKHLPYDLSESIDSREFDNYRPHEVLYGVLHRSKRDLIPEKIDENSILDLELYNVCTFDLSVRNYVNVKYNKKEMPIDSVLSEILDRSNKISNIDSERTFLKKLKTSFNPYEPKCKAFGSQSTKCMVLRIDDFLRRHCDEYLDRNMQTIASGNNVRCVRSSDPDLINRQSIICNSSRFYNIFKRKPIFDMTGNERLSRNDHLARQIFAVVMMLHEEITTSKGLKRYLFRNKYPRLIRTINEMYNCVNDVNYFETLYNQYSPFSGRAISDKNDTEKLIAVKFFDLVFWNGEYSAFNIDDVLHVIAYLEKRRLIYNMREELIHFSMIDLSSYLHVILSFIVSFK